MAGQQLRTDRRKEAGKPIAGIIAEYHPTDNVRSARHENDPKRQQNREDNGLFANRWPLKNILGAHGYCQPEVMGPPSLRKRD